MKRFNQLPFRQKVFTVMGLCFIAAYLLLGLAFVFMKDLPFNLTPATRIGFGLILISYAVFRLIRLHKDLGSSNSGTNE